MTGDWERGRVKLSITDEIDDGSSIGGSLFPLPVMKDAKTVVARVL